MNITAKSVASKLFVAFVAASMLVMLATPAKAATAEELQAQIDALMAQIAALQGSTPAATTPAAGCTFTRALTVGSQGADVKCLQDYLTPKYFTNAGGSTGYFGPVTAAAVAAWQTANGVTPAAGYFGPVSQAKYAALMAAAPAPSTDDSDDEDSDTTTGELGNDEGSIKTVTEVSSDESSLEEGTEGGVLAFELEIEGDVEINRVDVYAEVDDSTTASDNADDYFTRAFLMVDGEEVAELDVEDFGDDTYTVVTDGTTGDQEYRLRFSGLNLVFADGDEPEFQVGFEVLGSLDSADLAADWDLELDSIRFVDGEGFTDSNDSIGIAESFDFDAEEVGSLRVSKSTDNPKSQTLEIDDKDTSDEIGVFMFEIEERNGVDVTIEDLRVTVTTGVTSDESAVVDEAILYNGSTELASKSVSNGGVVTFENIGLDIAGDETEELTVKLVFNGSEDHAEGSTVNVAFTSIVDAEDENGNDEGDMTISGSAAGETHTLRSVGIAVEVSEAETTITAEDGANNDRVTFTWELDITAFGDEDVYVNKDFADIVASQTAGDVDQVYLVTVSSGAALTAVSGTITSDADDVTADADAYGAAYLGETFYRISGGDTETFTITVVGTNQTDAKQVQSELTAIEWTTDLVDATTEDAEVAAINSYSDNLADDSETPFKSIN